MLLTSHTFYINKNAIIFGFFQVNRASLQRTSSTIILLLFENVVNNILFVLLVCFCFKSVNFQSCWSPS